jgi:hypothetical protein
MFLLSLQLSASTAAAVLTHDSQSGLAESFQAGLHTHRTKRLLQQNTPSAASLQQALQTMMAVPFATHRSVLALGHKGLEPETLRNWHLLARKLSTPGANVTIVAFGGSITAGYLKLAEDWQSSLQGSWVESLVAWLKVGCCC